MPSSALDFPLLLRPVSTVRGRIGNVAFRKDLKAVR
jgi:hypothetical protein